MSWFPCLLGCKDDCSVSPCEKYSVFVWDNGKKRRHIYHKPNCPIPIVQVNENDEAVALFASEYNLTDSLNEDAITTIKTSTTTLDHQCGDATDKQSSAELPDTIQATAWIPKEGDVVRFTLNNMLTVGVITRTIILGNGETRIKARLLNGATEVTINPKKAFPITNDPADIPPDHKDIDDPPIATVLTEKELKRLWSSPTDDTVTPEGRTALRWHHRLQCVPLQTLQRLSKRGVIPACIQRVKKLPIYASCVFAAAHRKRWRHKGAKESLIRRKTDTYPGAGTSCDHIVSHQPEIIPQATGRPTNAR